VVKLWKFTCLIASEIYVVVSLADAFEITFMALKKIGRRVCPYRKFKSIKLKLESVCN